VLQDVLKRIDADTVVVLQATSPIRNPDLIDNCIRSMAPLSYAGRISKASFMMMEMYM